MNGVNSKNLTFMILFVSLLAIIFTYSLIFHHDEEAIYTDLTEISIGD